MYFEHYDNETNLSLMDDTNSFGENDNFLGLGNKKKQAERKLKRAEKQLDKGHTKRASKLIAKAAPILGKIQRTQTGLISSKQQLGDINQTKDYIKSFVPAQTESLQTTAGQIGTEAGATVVPNDLAARQTLGGGGGDITYSGGGGNLSDMESTLTEGGGETSTETSPKELQGVTVSAKKTNWVMIAAIGGAILLVVMFILPKLLKKK